MSVWRYGLYDAATGDRVTLHSGFPIEYTDANGKAWQGQMGYYGLWLPQDVAGQVTNGATVQRVQYVPDHEPTKTPYTLVKADGRLMKYTKQSRTLAAADHIKFTTWVSDATGFYAGAEGNKQYEMYWDDAHGVFKASGTMECGSNGCQTRDLPAEQSVQASYFVTQGGVRGWSQSLGGEVFIPLAGSTVDSAQVNVIYRVQDLVYPAQMPAASSAIATVQRLAGSVGTALLGSLLQHESHVRASLPDAFDATFVVALMLTAVAVVPAFFLPGRPVASVTPQPEPDRVPVHSS